MRSPRFRATSGRKRSLDSVWLRAMASDRSMSCRTSSCTSPRDRAPLSPASVVRVWPRTALEIRESMYSSSEPCAVAWLPLLPPPLPDTWANSSIMDSGIMAAASVPRASCISTSSSSRVPLSSHSWTISASPFASSSSPTGITLMSSWATWRFLVPSTDR